MILVPLNIDNQNVNIQQVNNGYASRELTDLIGKETNIQAIEDDLYTLKGCCLHTHIN